VIFLRLETEHFVFEALGNDGDEAGDALKHALQYHAEMYDLPENWHTEYDISRMEISPGECFRDRQLLYRKL
jgi:hypothetical protein